MFNDEYNKNKDLNNTDKENGNQLPKLEEGDKTNGDENVLVPAKRQREKYADGVEEREYTQVRETEIKEETHSFLGAIVAIIALLLVLLLFYFGYNYIKTDGTGFDSRPANEVLAEKDSAGTKSQKTDPSKAYELKNAKDTLNGSSVSIDRIQFRQDQTRLWIHLKNGSPNRIHMMRNVNAILVEKNGHQYKTDPFSGDQITAIESGVDQEFMLAFEPVRADAKEITFNLDMVFDMKKPAWKIVIPVKMILFLL